VKPNLSEWNEYVKHVGSEAKGIGFLFTEGTQSILVTQGSQGVRLITPTSDVIVLPKEGIEVIDVTGAGDSLAAAISLVIGEGHSLSDNLENLNLIGANTVRHAKTELPGPN
jgi:D-beta-D-heptose 7-phosphate kinase/D-beta-D-heptose 1-phosphate adenosyltransferase